VIFSPHLPLNEMCNSCLEFVAHLYILTSSGTGIKRGFQGTVFIASCKQNADVVEIIDKVSSLSMFSFIIKYLFLLGEPLCW